MLLLLAELNARPGAAKEVSIILQGLADLARHEPGNVAYNVHRQQDNLQAFVLYELYRDRAACDAHLASPPVQQALQRFETLLTAPPRVVFCDTLATAGVA
jgi:quinol monooxygenase YgiN